MKRSSTLMFALLICMVANSSPRLFNPLTSGPEEEIRSNLYVRTNSSTILLDGDLTQYDPQYSNAVDGKDARKMSNFSENIGMLREATTLVIERRQTITLTDTIFYKIWQLHQQPYQLEFITSNLNHPGLVGFLEDSYLKTSTPIDLNGITTANFSVTADPLSAATLRFRIVFKTEVAPAPMPFTFTSVQGLLKNNSIMIDWKTENELNIKDYSVEKSVDGSHFNKLDNVKANNFKTNDYTWVDAVPAIGYNYYRITTKGTESDIKYSETLKILNILGSSPIKIYPNPVVNNTIHIQIANQPAGVYEMRLINNFGQVMVVKNVQHAGGNIIETITPNQTLQKGVYQLNVTTTGKTKLTEKIVY